MIQGPRYVYFYKIIWFLLAGLFLMASLAVDSYDNAPQLSPQVHKKIQATLLHKISELENQVNEFAKAKKRDNRNPFKPKSDCFLHIYKNNELVYWNTNQLPISATINHNEIKNGVFKLSNGYYYIFSKKINNLVFQGSFLIQSEYEIENEYLTNTFNSSIYDGKAHLAITQKSPYSIKDKSKNHLFYITSKVIPNTFASNSTLTFVLLFGSYVCFLIGLYRLTKNRHLSAFFSFLGLLIIRLACIYYLPLTIYHNQSFQSASLFPFNNWFPTILGLILNLGIFIFGFLAVLNFVNSRKQKIGQYFFIVLSFLLWWLMLDLINVLVENSDVSLTLDLPFTLTFYSYLLVALVGILFYFYYYGLSKTIINLKNEYKSSFVSWIIILFATLLFVIFRASYYETTLFSMLLPFVLAVLIEIGQVNKAKSKNSILQLLVLSLFAASFITELNTQNHIKEIETRKLYANNLLLERDYEAELNYSSFEEDLISDTSVARFFNVNKETLIASKVNDFFKRAYFSGSWEAYSLGVTLLDSSFNTIMSKDGLTGEKARDLINNHGKQSEINSNIFFLKDSYLGYSYLIKQTLPQKMGTIIFSFKSKKIPEEIGFPRLLLSSEAKVLKGIINYSSAKYFNGILVKQRGNFHFPTRLTIFKTSPGKDAFINFNAYNHYVSFKGKETAVVLSYKIRTNYDDLTSFSYVFCFWGLLLFLINILSIVIKKDNYSWTLALKIQLMSVSLVILSLVFFGTVSGLFVSRQYEYYNNKTITDKVKSISTEISNKVAQISSISKTNDATFFELLTDKLAAIFETDINVYDLKGQLVGASKPEVFSLGLQSEQINPTAFNEFKSKNTSMFSQKENIGKLVFYSVYMPVYNGKNEALGLINIQQFNRQRDFDLQIQSFLVSITNIFILLLAGAIIISLLVSNRLVQPLKQLQTKVKAISFGQRNQHIIYTARDEISTIVDAYNNKLDELEHAIKQLKLNERESAWREMAKQVAHEIKNPLTPIKLSVQQLLRVYDPNDPSSKSKIELIVHAIIEQIDGLVKIANDFSLFAQLPAPYKKETDLVLLIKNVLPMFSSYGNMQITLESQEPKLMVNLDKDQWVQVFNNLLKNATQACSETVNPRITVYLTQTENGLKIEIKDNGCGIAKEEMDKIFTPHFTTKSTGSGIGLSLVKQIVENHGGTITFISKQNKGTTFTIFLS